MKNAKARIIYQLLNDVLRYLLKYGTRESYTDADFAEMLNESADIIDAYKREPCGIGYLSQKLLAAVNSYIDQVDKRRKGE